HTISSLNSNTIVNFNTVQTSRGLDVLYDVELIARHTDTKEEEIVGSPHYGIRDVYNLDMNFTPRDIDNDKLQFYIKVKTYNVYGRTLGSTKSPIFRFTNPVTFNIDYIAAKNDPFIPIHPTSTTVNSVDKVIKIGYSGKKDSYDNYLKVEVRSYDTRTNQYTEWTNLGEQKVFIENGEIEFTFDTFRLNPNGFKVYDIKVSKSVNSTSVVTRYAYDIFGDTFSVNYSNQDRMFEAIKLPVEVLKDTKVRAEFSVIKEKFSFDMNIDKNMKIQASNEYSDRTIVATNKPTSDVLLTNKDHFNTISDDVFASYSISLNNIQSNLEIGFTDQKEIFIIFDKGNSDEVYWNNKNFTKV